MSNSQMVIKRIPNNINNAILFNILIDSKEAIPPRQRNALPRGMKESGVNSGGKGSPVRRTGDSQEYQACNRYFLINLHKT
jgi:hypothetical protein